MISWILLVIALVALTVLGTYFFGHLLGRGEVVRPIDDHVDHRARNVAAVLDRRLDDLQFELVPRGYRPDQVDAVIDALTMELARAKAGKDYYGAS
ncbi:hypothetical protein FHE74_01085 [Corynebacterium tapiri]|uniref:DivIVA domain-containing protein n=1 Tax=Corynebacterium tapiri TaxID=1448266 RepID=A0A5C4U6Q0_9CORY|nr:hypothetical protein FHE74_01085 [Corynebacterium tapiri]